MHQRDRDPDEELTAEALRRFESPEAALQYLVRAERRRDVIQDHERRIIALEHALPALREQLEDIAKEAHETRIEQNGMLRTVVDQVNSISREQTLDIGRKEGAALIAAQAAAAAEKRAQWVKWALPITFAIGLYLATQFVQDIVVNTP